MSSRRGRLNWSNLEVHISDETIDKQHRFTAPNSRSPASTPTENMIEVEKETTSPKAPAVKRAWMPKTGVGEIQAEQFVGNFMLTSISTTLNDYFLCLTKLIYLKMLNKLLLIRNTINKQVKSIVHKVLPCHNPSEYRIDYLRLKMSQYRHARRIYQSVNIC